MPFARLFSALVLSLFAAAPAVLTAADAPVSHRSYIVTDAATGNVLLQDSPDEITPPASVTKLMTFLVVHDAIAAGRLTLDTPVQVAAEDAKIGGTQVWLDPRETFPVRELLYAMMIQSANDASNALARAAAGSREAFVTRMNERARALGMNHTTWRTPHGLPPSDRKVANGDLTTARDLSLLARELVTHTDVLTYTSVRTRNFGEGSRPQPVVMTNHNHLLGKIPGVDGLKTGFTNAAGFCLAATVERDGRRLVAVIMGSENRKVRDKAMSDLIDKGFAALPADAPAFAAQSASPIRPAPGGDSPIQPAPVQPAPASAAKTVPAEEPPPTVRFTLPPKR